VGSGVNEGRPGVVVGTDVVAGSVVGRVVIVGVGVTGTLGVEHPEQSRSPSTIPPSRKGRIRFIEYTYAIALFENFSANCPDFRMFPYEEYPSACSIPEALVKDAGLKRRSMDISRSGLQPWRG
jgi:hypothetical protein